MLSLVELVKAGIPAKAQKSERQRATGSPRTMRRNWRHQRRQPSNARPWVARLALSQHSAPPPRPSSGLATSAAAKASRFGKRPEQPRPRPVTAAEIVAAAAKRDKPTSGAPMGAAAKAIILAGQRKRNEV